MKSGMPLRSGMSKPRPLKKGMTSLQGPWNSMCPAQHTLSARCGNECSMKAHRAHKACHAPEGYTLNPEIRTLSPCTAHRP